MEIKNIRGMDPRFKFIIMNEPGIVNIVNPTSYIELEEYPANDLYRYCLKLFWDSNKEKKVDYNKVIKQALAEYLKKHIGKKELSEIEKMKAEEKRLIEEAQKEEKPKYAWDLSNRKEKKNEKG